MSESVDVVAIRAALDKATPGPWEVLDLTKETGETGRPWWWVWRTEALPYYGGVLEMQQPSGLPGDALSDAHGLASAEITGGIRDDSERERTDAELIVLLRNNAEALLNAVELLGGHQ